MTSSPIHEALPDLLLVAGDTVLRAIASRVGEFVANQFLSHTVVPPIDRLRLKNKVLKSVQYEVANSLRRSAKDLDIPDEFLKEKADLIAQEVISKPEVKKVVRQELQGAEDGEEGAALKNISAFLSDEGVKEMKKQWKGKGKMTESFAGTLTDIPRGSLPGFLTTLPRTAMEMIRPFFADDMAAGTGFLKRTTGVAVNKAFFDGISSELVSIANQGRTLQINPATREAFLIQGNRRVYLGTLDTWDDLRIRKLIIRYLGTVADGVVHHALRELGLLESTTSSAVALPMSPLTATVKPGTAPFPVAAKRKKRA